MSLTEQEEERLNLILTELGEGRKLLSDWEKSFLDDQVKRYEQYGSKIFMSPKQWAVLQRMHDKINKE